MSVLESVIAGTAGDRIAPKVRCADGFTVSVQASWGHYCADSEGKRPDPPYVSHGNSHGNASLPYTSVEVGYPSERPEPWDQWEQYAESPDTPTGTVYGWVPVTLVRDLIAAHGGEVTR